MDREQKLLEIIGDRIALAKLEFEQHQKQLNQLMRAKIARKARGFVAIATLALFANNAYIPANATTPYWCKHQLYSSSNFLPRGVVTSTNSSLPHEPHVKSKLNNRQTE